MTWLLKGQNTRLYFKLKTPNDEVFENEWVIKNYETLENTPKSVVYKLFCELDCTIPLNTICEYATSTELKDENGIDGNERAYEIAVKILKEYGFNYYTAEAQEKPRFMLPNSHYVKFITYQNMTVLNAVKYLLSVGCGSYDLYQPAYLIYNIYNNKGFISTKKQLIANKSDQPDQTKLILSVGKGNIVSKQQQVKLAQSNIIDDAGINFSKLYFNYDFYNFDQIEKLWYNSIITKLDIDEVLTAGINNAKETSLFSDVSEEETYNLTKKYKFRTVMTNYIYDVLKNLDLFSSNIKFVIEGNIFYDVGHVIEITSDSNQMKSSNNQRECEMYDGLWMIINVKHTFTNKNFTTVLTCSRTYFTTFLRE